MKDKIFWLFIEPYVQMIQKGDHLLLYNTLSKKVHELRTTGSLSALIKALLDPETGYVVKVTEDQVKKEEVQKFIRLLRKEFLGDLLDAGWSEAKPVTIFPEPYVKYGFNPHRVQTVPGKPAIDLRNYLQEITLFLNSHRRENQDPFDTAFLQFSYPGCVTGRENTMDPGLFRRIIDEVNNYTPTLIHLSGENLMHYPHLEEVINILDTSPFQKKYHLLAEHWDEKLVPKVLSQPRTTLSLYLRFPLDPGKIVSHLQRLTEDIFIKRLEFNLIVSDQATLQEALEMASILDLPNIFFKPVFTGDNLDFFKENVFVAREEILASKPNQQQVFSRMTINENDFGKLWILPGGEVHANLNDPPLGLAKKEYLHQLVARELDDRTSWGRTRATLMPCRGCVYQFLCPPVSSYEIFMNRFNFCDIILNDQLT